MITKLIDRTNFTEDTIPIPAGLGDERLNRYIIEAQESELKPKIGNALYNDLLKNSGDANYTALLDGEEYTNTNGDLILFNGLRMALIHWAYAKLIQRNQKTLTPTGYVKKTNQYSEQIEYKELSADVQDYMSLANIYWADCVIYLNEKYADFPKWNTERREKLTTSTIRINAIGGYGNNINECNDYNT